MTLPGPPLEVDVLTRNEIYGFPHLVTGPALGLPAVQAPATYNLSV